MVVDGLKVPGDQCDVVRRECAHPRAPCKTIVGICHLPFEHPVSRSGCGTGRPRSSEPLQVRPRLVEVKEVPLRQGLPEVCDALPESRFETVRVRERIRTDHREWVSKRFPGLIAVKRVCVVSNAHGTILSGQHAAQARILPYVDNWRPRTSGMGRQITCVLLIPAVRNVFDAVNLSVPSQVGGVIQKTARHSKVPGGV